MILRTTSSKPGDRAQGLERGAVGRVLPGDRGDLREGAGGARAAGTVMASSGFGMPRIYGSGIGSMFQRRRRSARGTDLLRAPWCALQAWLASNACSRSAIRSSTSSMPHESRTRLSVSPIASPQCRRHRARGSSTPDARSGSPRRPATPPARKIRRARRAPGALRRPQRRTRHPAEAAHLPARELVLRMRRRAPGSRRVPHLARCRRASRRPAGRSRRAARMRSGSVLVPRSASQQSIGPGTPPAAFCRKPSRSRQVVAVGHQHAAHHVAVAVQVLGGGVEHDVGAQLERPLEERRREGVVHREQDAARPARGRRRAARSVRRIIGLVGVSQ